MGRRYGLEHGLACSSGFDRISDGPVSEGAAVRNIRVEGDLWEAANRAARDLGYRDLAVYIEDALRELIAAPERRQPAQTGRGPSALRSTA